MQRTAVAQCFMTAQAQVNNSIIEGTPEPSSLYGIATAWVQIDDIDYLTEALLCHDSSPDNNKATAWEARQSRDHTRSMVPHLKRHGHAEI